MLFHDLRLHFKSTVCTKNGQCFAFGDNEFGQLGIKGLSMSYEPVRAQELESHHILYVACGTRHSSALSGKSRRFIVRSQKSRTDRHITLKFCIFFFRYWVSVDVGR